MSTNFILDAGQAKEIFGDGKTLFYEKIREIKDQILKGRYPRSAIIEDKKIRVAFYVYYDYSMYRKQLLNNAKHVPDYDPLEIAKVCPVVTEVVFMERGERYEGPERVG